MDETKPIPRHNWKAILGLTLACLVCSTSAVLPFWDLMVTRAGSVGNLIWPREPPLVTIGAGVDLLGTLWTFDFVGNLLSGEATMDTPLLFAPYGFDAAMAQGMAWLDAIIAYPLALLMGNVGFYNVYIWLMLSASQACCYLLFRQLNAPAPIAFGLSVFAQYNPFMMFELHSGRSTQVHLVFVALFLLFVVRLTQPNARPVRDGVLAGLMMTAGCLIYWFGAMTVGVMAAMYLVISMAIRPEIRRTGIIGGAVLSVTALTSASLAAWPLVRRLLAGESPPAGYVPNNLHFTFLGFEFPILHTVKRTSQFDSWDQLWPSILELGFPAPVLWLGLLALVAVPLYKRALPWLAVGLLTLTIPLGAAFIIKPTGDTWPTLFNLLMGALPIYDRCNFPQRLITTPVLALLCAAAVALAWGAHTLTEKNTQHRWLPWVAGAALIYVGLNLDNRRPLAGFTEVLPEKGFYEAVEEHLSGGVIDVPLDRSNEAYVYQLVHNRQILGGPGIKGPNTRPEGHMEYVTDNTFLHALDLVSFEPWNGTPRYDTADLERWREDGFGTIIVHRAFVKAKTADYTALLGPRHIAYGEALVAFPLPER